MKSAVTKNTATGTTGTADITDTVMITSVTRIRIIMTLAKKIPTATQGMPHAGHKTAHARLPPSWTAAFAPIHRSMQWREVFHVPRPRQCVRILTTTMRSVRVWARGVHDYVRVRSRQGLHARIPLRAGVSFGAAMSRGDRAQQEDAMSTACVMLPCEQLRQNLLQNVSRRAKRDPWYGWTCEEAGGEELAAQVVWFGCFDGHGGPQVSQLLQNKLHHVFEEADPSMVQDTVQYTCSIGGYFGRFQGGALERLVDPTQLRRPCAAPASLEALADATHASDLEHYVALDADQGAVHTQRHLAPTTAQMSMQERATLAWLMMDREIQQNEAYRGAGSTASVLLLHSLDVPTAPWYASEYLAVTTVQLGDTRLVLCDAETGEAIPLTRLHHPDDPIESDRLSRQGAGVLTDSFGESRFLGTLANTRSFGDTQAKRYGMTAEPEVQTHILQGSRFAFIAGFSDGIGDVMTDQELVDECRYASHPQQAAERIMKYAEDLGAEDNATILCIPLRGWGAIRGEDRTALQRRDRRLNTDIYRNRRNLCL